MHDSLTFEFDWPDNEYALQTAWIIKNLWQEAARTMPTPSGEPLGWNVPIELSWGKRWGSPEWQLRANGVCVSVREDESL